MFRCSSFLTLFLFAMCAIAVDDLDSERESIVVSCARLDTKAYSCR